MTHQEYPHSDKDEIYGAFLKKSRNCRVWGYNLTNLNNSMKPLLYFMSQEYKKNTYMLLRRSKNLLDYLKLYFDNCVLISPHSILEDKDTYISRLIDEEKKFEKYFPEVKKIFENLNPKLKGYKYYKKVMEQLELTKTYLDSIKGQFDELS